MAQRSVATHTIRIAAPIERCQHFFTPIGEEAWVDGWKPTYIVPIDGHTEPGMVFTTGSGDDHTIWTLIDFDTTLHRALYSRVTPATRTALVEVRCTSIGGGRATDVRVSYTVTALTPSGVPTLAAYEGKAFVEMIEGWREAVEARLPQLLGEP